MDTAASQKEDVDTIWLAEPQRDTAWAGTHGDHCFSILPMVHVDLSGHKSVMGPLNNETKRRAGTHLMPMTTSLWCRDAMFRFLMRKFFLENFQVYVGDADAGWGAAGG